MLLISSLSHWQTVFYFFFFWSPAFSESLTFRSDSSDREGIRICSSSSTQLNSARTLSDVSIHWRIAICLPSFPFFSVYLSAVRRTTAHSFLLIYFAYFFLFPSILLFSRHLFIQPREKSVGHFAFYSFTDRTGPCACLCLAWCSIGHLNCLACQSSWFVFGSFLLFWVTERDTHMAHHFGQLPICSPVVPPLAIVHFVHFVLLLSICLCTKTWWSHSFSRSPHFSLFHSVPVPASPFPSLVGSASAFVGQW